MVFQYRSESCRTESLERQGTVAHTGPRHASPARGCRLEQRVVLPAKRDTPGSGNTQQELIADARAAGITEINALVSSDNPAAAALLRRIANVFDIRFEGAELSIRAAIA